jgi:hypothetical protein
VIDIPVWLLVMIGVSLWSILPALGMSNAAFLVFMGTLNYVVYRDIFERRGDGSLPYRAVNAARPHPCQGDAKAMGAAGNDPSSNSSTPRSADR